MGKKNKKNKPKQADKLLAEAQSLYDQPAQAAEGPFDPSGTPSKWQDSPTKQSSRPFVQQEAKSATDGAAGDSSEISKKPSSWTGLGLRDYFGGAAGAATREAQALFSKYMLSLLSLIHI